MQDDSILWRMLDAPGHDACRLLRRADGWLLEGAAAWLDPSGPALLAYEVEADATWRSRRGSVRGWIGPRALAHAILRAESGAWTLDGAAVAGLEGCVDLDLDFTPATNLFAIRRLDLAPGRAADAPAAWLDVAAGTLSALPQRYMRQGEREYDYEAPSLGYAARLEVAPSGFVLRYPELWERAEPR